MVEKCTSSSCPSTGTGTVYWRNLGGDPISESGLNGTVNHEYIFFNGKRAARRDITGNVVSYYFSDHLGSTDVVTTVAGTITKESDYYPYGGEIPISGSDINNYKFTGKERDSESNLDNFGARYYGSSLGRFMTPDPLLNSGRPWAPQTWNRYAYTQNNPLRNVDPSGLYDYAANCKSGSAGDTCRQNRQRFDDAVAKANQLLKTLPKDSKQYSEVKKALGAIGTSGDKNGVLISFGQTKTGGTMETSGKNITVDFGRLDAGIGRYQNAGYKTDVGIETATEVTHEGIHLTREAPTWAANKWDIADSIEREAYGAQSGASEAGGSESIVWNNSWAASADKETLRQDALDILVLVSSSEIRLSPILRSQA